jgi:hypothetical protein
MQLPDVDLLMLKDGRKLARIMTFRIKIDGAPEREWIDRL